MKESHNSRKNITDVVSEMLTKAKLQKVALDSANFLITAVVTSAATSLVQSPASAFIFNNLTRGKVFSGIPFVSAAMAHRLYRGYTASLPGGTARNAYMSSSKKNANASETPSEGSSSENTSQQKIKFSFSSTFSFSFADTFLTQFSEMKSHLIRLGTINESFNCRTRHNTRVLMTAAFAPRLIVSHTTYSLYFLLNERIAEQIQIENQKTKYFLSGAACGALAALVMFPITYLRDTIIEEIKPQQDKLIPTKVSDILSNFTQLIKQEGMSKILNKNGYRLLELAFLRILRSSLTLAIVSGVVSGMGCEPLTSYFKQESGLENEASPKP